MSIDPDGLKPCGDQPWGAGRCFGPGRDCAYKRTDDFHWWEWWDKAAWRHDIEMERQRIQHGIPRGDTHYFRWFYWPNHVRLLFETFQPIYQLLPVEPLGSPEPQPSCPDNPTPPIPNPPTTPGGSGSSGTATSLDPNRKIGPAGFSSAGYIRADDQLAYRIDFENDPNATAPAQQVIITDPLDSDLDWTTFQLTEIGFGDQLIAVPNNT